ncbi:hypothetical protein GCM10023350_08790 [Nocardioides endophyticus]|uniref:SD-repeat containing protein B domain-containing protein n=1 Tax=Nocardioides endophyticus TaxID=1353775 RepID=A0ABP8YG10_9ACTN
MVAVVIAGLGASSLPAVAAPGDETLTLTLTQETGTGPFDGDNAPGHDSGAGNDVVRTNDTISYTVGIRYEGGDATAPTMTFTLPQGQELVSLPPFCKAGSSVTPASIGAPVQPVTATSYQSLPAQTVTCVVDNQSEGTALDYKFVAKVRPEMPQGAAMGPFTVSATTNQVSTPAVSPSVSQVVSAAADFDVSKRGTSTNENTGPYYQEPGLVNCSFDTTRLCRRIHYPLTVNSTPGGKGITPLASPITMTDDISPAVFYGAATWASAVALAGSEAAAIAKYAPRLDHCGNVTHLWGGLPYTAGGSESGEHGAVSNSGSINCVQPGGEGTPVDITITGADTTGYYVPTQTGNHTALPADTGYVVAFTVLLDVPLDAVLDIGDAGVDGNTWTLATENTYTNIVMNDITGAPNTGEDLSNNDRDAVIAQQRGEGFDKWFSAPWGRAGNVPAVDWNPNFQGWEGMPGSSYPREGNAVVLPGQPVISNLFFQSSGGVPHSGTTYSRSYFGCDVWDDTQLGLTPGNWAGGGQSNSRPSNGEAAWASIFINGIDGAQPISDLRNLKIQYSSGPGGPGAASDCTTGSWYDTPAAVPGAVLDAAGVYSGVNRVRVSFSSDFPGDQDWFFVNLAIAQTVRATAGVQGDIIGNWAAYKRVEGLKTMDQVLADPSVNYMESTYDPATHGSAWGDRLTIGTVTARIRKWVRNPGNGTFTDTAVPQYTAGSNVDYRLNPTLTADVPAGVTAPVIVEDCLPRYQQFVSSKREASGVAITPDLIQMGAPAGSELTCPANRQYVRWDLGQQGVGQTIDPIVYTVEILDTVRNGVYTNTTLVTSAGDPTAAALRQDTADIQIVVPTGIKIAKSTPQTVVEVNPSGVASPRRLHWTVDFANIDAPQNVGNVDIVDILPADGVNGSDFTGTLAFDTATVAAGTGISILYTRTAAGSLALDPAASANGAAGTTVWCDAPSGGAVVSGAGTAADCPSAAGQVTGLRFLRPGDFAPGDELTVDITMTPSGNAGGDVYNNRTSGRADGVSQGVGPASRAIQIIESSIGNYVWLDEDRNGVQDAGEKGVAGFTVKLTGTDLDGNSISASTTTDADGHYLFTGLPSGTYEVTFDPASLKAWQAFTTQGAGGDDTKDSDGNVTTGKVAAITLDPDTQLLSVDQGVVVDKKRPGYVTTISDQATTIGDKVTDQVVVSNLFTGEPIQMHWQLYGPYAAKADMTCQPADVFAEGDMTLSGNGTVTTPAVTLTKAGYYTYAQSSAATAAYEAQRTDCGIEAETTLVTETVPPLPPTKSTVKVKTVSSHQRVTLPVTGGVKVSDKVIIKGLPDGVDAKVTGALYGPFATEKAIRCNPANTFGKVKFTAHGKSGQGVYRTSKVKITEPGWYSWAMKVSGTRLSKSATEGCGKPKETLLATRAQAPVPPVPTGFAGFAAASDETTSSEGGQVLVGGGAATDEGEELDFLEEVAAIVDRADGVEDGNIPAGTPGDLPVVTEEEAAELAAQGAAGDTVPEVALAPSHSKRLFSPEGGIGVRKQSGTTVKIPAVGINTSVDRSDIAGGVLAVPSNVGRVGWFGRSAHVGDVIGASVIAGHVSDSHDRPGAFYRLKNVRRGDIVTVVQNGRTHRFKVTGLKTYDRTRQLPADAFATSGKHRLSLITCTGKVTYPNGRFHYTKNLVVTAEEVR